jgi:hypothetical protein
MTKPGQHRLRLPDDWSPDQALAVFEIIDLLRDCVWLHYGPDIQQALRDQPIQRDPRQLPLPLDPDPPF